MTDSSTRHRKDSSMRLTERGRNVRNSLLAAAMTAVVALVGVLMVSVGALALWYGGALASPPPQDAQLMLRAYTLHQGRTNGVLHFGGPITCGTNDSCLKATFNFRVSEGVRLSSGQMGPAPLTLISGEDELSWSAAAPAVRTPTRYASFNVTCQPGSETRVTVTLTTPTATATQNVQSTCQ